MKRPLYVIGIVFMFATRAAFLFDRRTALLLSAALAATGVLLQLLRRPGLRAPALACLAAALAAGGYALYSVRVVESVHAIGNTEVAVQGFVLEKSGSGRSAAYLLRADFPDHPELPQGRNVLLYSYGEPELSPGDGVRMDILARLPESTASADYYRARGVAVIGYPRGQAYTYTENRYRLERFLLRLRERMSENLIRNLSDGNAQVVGAMVLGLQDDVPPELYNAVGRAGTAHLLTVSGLHLSIITAFVLGGLKRLGLPKIARGALAVPAAFLFAGLVGFSGSIMRAFVMTLMVIAADSLSRDGDSRTSLGLALLLICIARPYWTLGRGLWLSAASTLGIIVLAPGALAWLRARIGKSGRFSGRFLQMTLGALAVSLCAYVYSLPVLVLTTGWLSVVSPVANMLAAPFVTPLILCGAGCALLPGTGPIVRILAAVTDFCTGMVLGISEIMSSLPFATVSLDEGYLLLLLAGTLAGAAVVFHYRPDRRIAAYGLALLALCAGAGDLSLRAAQRDVIELAVVDRCGSAVLLRGGQAVLLGMPTRYNISRLLRYLEFRGVERVAAVFAPDCPERPDSGLTRLRDRYRIDCVIGPDDAVVLAGLEAALPDTQVFSGGYARTQVLGGAVVTAQAAGSGLRVDIGESTLYRLDLEYEPGDAAGGDILIFRDGAVLLPARRAPLVEPVGRYLFGEVRVPLHVTLG